MDNNFVAIILAAGEGKRMKSHLPKVLHCICGKPMIEYSFDLVKGIKSIKRVILVLGYRKDLFKKYVNSNFKIKIIRQKKLLGTADAVKRARHLLRSFKGNIVVLYADNPLFRPDTIGALLRYHLSTSADCTLLTAERDNPFGYGRVIRDYFRKILGVIEEADSTDIQKGLKETTTGALCFKAQSLFNIINKVKPDNRKKEYYLTDVVKMLVDTGARVESLKLSDALEAQGVNSQQELSNTNLIMRQRILEEFMTQGITIVDPSNTYIDTDVKIGKGSIIYPFTVIERNVKIGKHCQIGPFCRLRGKTQVCDRVSLGNFIEINRSQIDSETKAKHFSYLGDAHIGKKVNIGAGTVTANFDGKKKNITIIEDGAFIGSDTILIAPVKIGKKSITGAGSVVTKKKNVPANTIVAGVPARVLKKLRKR